MERGNKLAETMEKPILFWYFVVYICQVGFAELPVALPSLFLRNKT